MGATRVHHQAVEAGAQERDALFDAARPFAAGLHDKAHAAHEADQLRAAAVGPDGPALGIRHQAEQGGQALDLAALRPGFVVHIQAAVTLEGPHQGGGVIGKAPVRAVVKAHARCGALELRHLVAPGKDLGFRMGQGLAFPDIGVVLRVHDALRMAAFLVQGGRKKRVVAPAGLDHHGAFRRLDHEALPGLAIHGAGVERDPDLGPLLADGGDQQVPGISVDVLGFLHPADVHTLQALDLGRVELEALEDELAAVDRLDARLRNAEKVIQAPGADAVTEQAVHTVRDAGLELAGAEDAHLALQGHRQQGVGNAPAFARATAGIGHLVAGGPEQKAVGLGQLQRVRPALALRPCGGGLFQKRFGTLRSPGKGLPLTMARPGRFGRSGGNFCAVAFGCAGHG